MPPATMISLAPVCRAAVAKMIDFIPEAHTLFTVVASVDTGHPGDGEID